MQDYYVRVNYVAGEASSPSLSSFILLKITQNIP